MGVPLRLADRHDARVIEPVEEGRLVGGERVLEPVDEDRLLDALAVEDLVVRQEDVVTAPISQAIKDAVRGLVGALAAERAHASPPVSPASAASAATSRPAVQ
jgi:hypothetical protein